MTILSPSTLRNDIYNIMDEIIETDTPLFIKRNNKDLVLISGDHYRSMKETIYLQSIPGLVESIKEGDKETFESYTEEQTKETPDD